MIHTIEGFEDKINETARLTRKRNGRTHSKYLSVLSQLKVAACRNWGNASQDAVLHSMSTKKHRTACHNYEVLFSSALVAKSQLYYEYHYKLLTDLLFLANVSWCQMPPEVSNRDDLPKFHSNTWEKT